MSMEWCKEQGGYMAEYLTREAEEALHGQVSPVTCHLSPVTCHQVGDFVYGSWLGLFSSRLALPAPDLPPGTGPHGHGCTPTRRQT